MLQEIEVQKRNGDGTKYFTSHGQDWITAIVKELGPRFGERAARLDEEDLFVAENFADLKAHGFLAAGVPEELGGGGASHAELSTILRELAHYCASTAAASRLLNCLTVKFSVHIFASIFLALVPRRSCLTHSSRASY